MTEEEAFIPYNGLTFDENEMLVRSRSFYEYMNRRRSVRTFSERPIPKEVIENILMTAGTAPSGAHKQPWAFCVVQDASLRKEIRRLAEEEEYRNYHGRMSDRWLKDLEPFGTDHVKPFIETAPALIVVFKKSYDYDDDGKKVNNYYVNESVGIAVGMMLTAVHHAGLVALTHTPSPMNFLEKALQRPSNEKAYLNIPIGYPAEGTVVPDISRKPAEELIQWY